MPLQASYIPHDVLPPSLTTPFYQYDPRLRAAHDLPVNAVKLAILTLLVYPALGSTDPLRLVLGLEVGAPGGPGRWEESCNPDWFEIGGKENGEGVIDLDLPPDTLSQFHQTSLPMYFGQDG